VAGGPVTRSREAAPIGARQDDVAMLEAAIAGYRAARSPGRPAMLLARTNLRRAGIPDGLL